MSGGGQSRLYRLKYSIDTCALIHGYRRDYPPDVFPAVWAFMEQLVGAGALGASEEVLHELEEKDDEVLKWAKGNRSMFRPTDAAIQGEVSIIVNTYPRLVNPQSTPARPTRSS